jgi:hypothetical protein
VAFGKSGRECHTAVDIVRTHQQELRVLARLGARRTSGTRRRGKAQADQLLGGWCRSSFTMKKTDEQRREEILRLRALIEKGLSEKSLLSQMELSVEDEKRQLGQRRMDEKLQAMGPEDGKPKVCPSVARRRRFAPRMSRASSRACRACTP